MEEDYVSFETAKLLKEKGFDEGCIMWYEDDDCLVSTNDDYGLQSNSDHISKYFEYSAPTLQMAMKWLREVHNIFIQIELYSKHNNYCFELFQNTHRLMVEKCEVYNSFEETCEAAIEYCLTNLI